MGKKGKEQRKKRWNVQNSTVEKREGEIGYGQVEWKKVDSPTKIKSVTTVNPLVVGAKTKSDSGRSTEIGGRIDYESSCTQLSGGEWFNFPHLLFRLLPPEFSQHYLVLV